MWLPLTCTHNPLITWDKGDGMVAWSAACCVIRLVTVSYVISVLYFQKSSGKKTKVKTKYHTNVISVVIYGKCFLFFFIHPSAFVLKSLDWPLSEPGTVDAVWHMTDGETHDHVEMWTFDLVKDAKIKRKVWGTHEIVWLQRRWHYFASLP